MGLVSRRTCLNSSASGKLGRLLTVHIFVCVAKFFIRTVLMKSKQKNKGKNNPTVECQFTANSATKSFLGLLKTIPLGPRAVTELGRTPRARDNLLKETTGFLSAGTLQLYRINWAHNVQSQNK